MRRLIIFISAMASFAMAYPQLTATEAFSSAPASILPLIDYITRLDMIDYYNSGSATASKNVMQGQSRITALSPMSVSVSVTSGSECQIALLPMRGDTAIVCIETVMTPTPDSRVSVYDRDWKPLSGSSFAMPAVSAWLTPEGKKQADVVESQVPFMLASAQYSPETDTLVLTNRLSDFLSDDVYGLVKPYLLPSITYKWNSSRFVPVK